MIYVWRRSDGYIDASCSVPNGWKVNGCETTFHVLKSFSEWSGDVVDFIETARKNEAENNKG